VDLIEDDLDRRLDRDAVHVALPFDGHSTAPNAREVEQNQSNLVALIGPRRSRNSQAPKGLKPRLPHFVGLPMRSRSRFTRCEVPEWLHRVSI
jgi:hypothetical protein